MSDHNLARLAKLVLAGRSRRRRDFAYCDCVEGALLRELATRGTLSMRLVGCTFRAVPAKVHGSPSERKKWRQLMPDHALPQWKMPRELQITYPERRSHA